MRVKAAVRYDVYRLAKLRSARAHRVYYCSGITVTNVEGGRVFGVGQGGAVIALAALLSACASAPSAPLAPGAEAALRGPDFAALTRDAASFAHPVLKPVAIDFTRPLTLTPWRSSR